jgi:hypothetical protein
MTVQLTVLCTLVEEHVAGKHRNICRGEAVWME